MSRDLDSINPAFAGANRFGSFAALLPLAFGFIGMMLALGAAPNLPLSGNVLWIGCCAICITSLLMFLVPRLRGWRWRAQHFGVSTFYLGSVALPGLVSWLCFLVHGSPSPVVRCVLFACYACLVIAWAWRFVPMYRNIFHDAALRSRLYQLEGGNTYYLQRGDKLFFRQPGALDHFPSVWLVAGALPFGFALLFIAPEVVRWAGLPAPHVLFMTICLPWDMAFVSIAVRGWLIFYFYPQRIFKETGTRVYVDMATKPEALPRKQHNARHRRAV